VFEFQHHFIRFLSLDQVSPYKCFVSKAAKGLFQPIWMTFLTLLLSPPCDVYHSYQNFLQVVAKWIVTRAYMLYNSLACEAMRTDGKVWGGVWVYTASEIFFDAGMSIVDLYTQCFNVTFHRSITFSHRGRSI